MTTCVDGSVAWRRSSAKISSPRTRNPKFVSSSTPVGSQRIYRAPHATLRDCGNTRRRRKTELPPPPMVEHDTQHVWGEDGDELGGSEGDRHYLDGYLGGGHSPRSQGSGRQHRHVLMLRQTHEDFSASHEADNESYTHNTFYSNDGYSPSHKRSSFSFRHFQRSMNAQNFVQFVVLVFFGVIIFDSHYRVQQHKVQLEQYDEERAHILEQMMWIDQAAKKVHKKYAQKAVWDDLGDEKLEHEKKDELVEEAEGLRDAMKKLQLRIQLNARSRVERRFGQGPMEVNLKISDSEQAEKLNIALTDDTPHAAAVLLEQVDNGNWNTIKIQRLHDGSVQLSTNLPMTTPALEFVESSHTCRERGSVVLRQLEADSMDLNLAVLRIHLKDDIPKNELDVCIGKVAEGLDYLASAAESLPILRDAPVRSGYHLA